MSQVAVRLYRQLHRVRRNYQQAQIPLVGIVGFNEPPTTDICSHLASAFRAGTSVARQEGAGFRALRQAQQQLQVLKGCEEETREALRCWHQLCQAWSVRARNPQRPFDVRLTEPGTDSTDPRVQPSNGRPSTDTSDDGAHTVNQGCSTRKAEGDGGGVIDGVEGVQLARAYPGGGGPADGLAGVVRAGGGGDTLGQRALTRRLQELSMALEDGALLVERLYDANHLSLEDFDEQGAEVAEAEAAAGADGAGPAAVELRRELGFGKAAAEASGALAAVHPLPAALCTAPVAAARRQLDELAAVVAAAHPGLFPRGGKRGPPGGGSGGGAAAGAEGWPPGSYASGARSAGQQRGGVLRQQLEAISQVIFHQYKFRHEPMEWVYDGLAPALLPQVLARRRGIPLSLAVLYCSVARRLGLAAVPVKASADSRPSVDEGPAALHGLPPDVATRQAGRTVALAPPLDAWLVAAAAAASDDPVDAPAASAMVDGQGPIHGSGAGGVGADPAAGQEQGQGQEQGLFVDVDRRGRVLTSDEAGRRYRDLPADELAALLPYSPLELWIELVRVMVTAHTRRGESDLVAHWLVQALALDHRSPEWRVMGVQ